MGKQYGQLILEERCTIAHLHEAGQSIRQIAAALDRAPSTVSRELKRNRGTQVGYKPAMPTSRREPGAGQDRAWSATASCAPRARPARQRLVARADRRPAAPATRLQPASAMRSIYRFIYAQIRRTNDGAWRHYLPRGQVQTRLRAAATAARPRAHQSAVSPSPSAPPPPTPRHPGHWEADLMLFADLGQAILVAHERKSRLTSPRQAANQRPNPPPRQLLAWLEPLTRAAPDHHLRQRHRVRPALPPQQPARHPNLLLRSPQPLAKGRRRERHRTHAPALATQNRPRHHTRPSSTASSPLTTTPHENAWTSNPAEVFSPNCRFERCNSTPSLRSG